MPHGIVEPKLGRLPAKSDPRALHFARFAVAPRVIPAATRFWTKRTKFPLRTFGNLEYGSCTRASQALLAMRMERLEVGRTPDVRDEEVVRVYLDMTRRLYGGGDTGAYETDALSEWRKPELTFRDAKGRPLTIDAFTRVNHADQDELRLAIYLAAAKGIKVCLNLPRAWKTAKPPARWDLPAGQQPIGDYLPGSWGGHAMACRDFDEDGLWLVHSWAFEDQLVTWRAAAVYLDEAHVVIDSLNAWRKKPHVRKMLDLDGIRRAVNAVSSRKIA